MNMNPAPVIPFVGMGAAYMIGSDCYPYRVTRVLSCKSIGVRNVVFKLTGGDGMSENQEYSYGDCRGSEDVFTLRRNGRWVRQGESMKASYLVLGVMRAYHDPSF